MQNVCSTPGYHAAGDEKEDKDDDINDINHYDGEDGSSLKSSQSYLLNNILHDMKLVEICNIIVEALRQSSS